MPVPERRVVRLDLTPPTGLRLTRRTGVSDLVNSEVPLHVDFEQVGVGRVVEAWVSDELRLMANVEVPGELAELLVWKPGPGDVSMPDPYRLPRIPARPGAYVRPIDWSPSPAPPVTVVSVEQFQREFGGRVSGLPPLRLRRRGGFRTRRRVRRLREVRELLRPGTLRDLLAGHQDFVAAALDLEDRSAVCPHLSGWRERLDVLDDACRGCGAVLPRQGS